MNQEESNEKKLEKIRRMLDNPSEPLSDSGNDKYLSGLQRRLLGDGFEKQPIIHSSSPDKSNDITPSVIIHHRTKSDDKTEISTRSIIKVKERSSEEEQIFTDEELFEIEDRDESSIPEFIEVKPLRDTISISETITTDSLSSKKEKSLEDLA